MVEVDWFEDLQSKADMLPIYPEVFDGPGVPRALGDTARSSVDLITITHQDFFQVVENTGADY